MSMVVYDPDNEEGAQRRWRRFVPVLSALVFVAFVASAVVAVVVLGTLTPSEDPPEGLAFSESTPQQVEAVEDETIEIELDTTGGVNEFTVESVVGPATAQIDESTLLIEPAEDESGTVTVIVTACGNRGCASTTIVAEVIARNDPPRANLDEAQLAGGEQVITIPVLENDSDVDDSSLEILEADVVEGEGDVVVVDDGTVLEFRSEADALGPWTMTYVVTDGAGGFDQGTVTILDGNLEPQPVDDELSASVGERIRIAPLDNDIDDGGRDQLRIVEVSDPASGSVEFGADWIDFVAGAEPGPISFTYVVSDAKGREVPATITVAVTVPLLALIGDVATTSEDTAIDVDVLANDGPAAAAIDPQTLRIVSATSGTVAVGGGLVSYEPPPNAAGEAFIVYEVCSTFGDCGQSTLLITVDAVIDGSFSSDGEIRVPSVAGPQLIPWLAVSSGEQTPPAGSSFAISIDDRSLFSAVPTIANNGSMFFEPQPGTSGTATVRITASDPTNGQRVFVVRIVVL